MRHLLAFAALRVARIASFLFVSMLVLAWPAQGTTVTWIGALTGNWSAPANWNIPGGPKNGDDVVFNLPASGTITNDLSGLTLHSLTVNGSGFLLAGNMLGLNTGATIAVNSSGSMDVSLDLVLNGPATVNISSDATFNNPISGTGGITFNGTGASNVNINAANSYSGATTFNITSANVSPNGIPSGSAVTLASGTLFVDPATTWGSLAGAAGSQITDFSAVQLITGSDNTSTTFAGRLANGALVKVGTGTMTLSGVNTYNGGTTVGAGRLDVNGTIQSTTTVNAGATLGGTGTILADVFVGAGGTLAPGVSTGILAVGSPTLAAGSVVSIDINGTTVGTQYDQVQSGGFATLGSASLQLTFGFTPTAGQTFTILTASGGVGGTFASITSPGVLVAPTYNANNVVLTVIAVPPASIATFAGSPQSTTVNTAFATALQAVVRDAFSNPVAGASVTFTAPGSGASGTFAAAPTVTTNAGGVATAPAFTANTVSGSYTVTATTSGVATPANFSLTNTPGAPTNMSATAGTPQSATVNTAFATALQAVVRDAFANPVAGVSVTFAAPGSGASGTFAAGPTVITNAGGVATAPAFTANATSGSYTVTATAIGVATPANFSLTNAAAIVTTFSGPSPTGTGTISASFTGGGAACTFTTSQFIPVTGNPASPPGPAPASFPHGLFDFTLSGCTAASTITMTIVYPAALVAGTQYWKYGPTPGPAAAHWYVLPATIVGNTVTFTITDGGLGDDDLLANGTIVDQGGPGNPGPVGSPTAIPTLSQWAIALMTLLLLASGMLVHRRQR